MWHRESALHPVKALPVFHLISRQCFVDLVSRSFMKSCIIDIIAHLCSCPPMCNNGIFVWFLIPCGIQLNKIEFENLRDLGKFMYVFLSMEHLKSEKYFWREDLKDSQFQSGGFANQQIW